MYQTEGQNDNICTFYLCEGIGKNFPFNSILDFAILSDFKMRTVIICEVGSSVGFQTAKSLASIAPSPIF